MILPVLKFSFFNIINNKYIFSKLRINYIENLSIGNVRLIFIFTGIRRQTKNGKLKKKIKKYKKIKFFFLTTNVKCFVIK